MWMIDVAAGDVAVELFVVQKRNNKVSDGLVEGLVLEL
jgi:hypothetical protein